MIVTMETTRAFYDWGRWVAGCTRCPSALEVIPKQADLACLAPPKGCSTVSRIVWPDDPTGIVRALSSLPEHQRSWNWPADE